MKGFRSTNRNVAIWRGRCGVSPLKKGMPRPWLGIGKKPRPSNYSIPLCIFHQKSHVFGKNKIAVILFFLPARLRLSTPFVQGRLRLRPFPSPFPDYGYLLAWLDMASGQHAAEPEVVVPVLRNAPVPVGAAEEPGKLNAPTAAAQHAVGAL